MNHIIHYAPEPSREARLRLRRVIETLISTHPFFATLILRMPTLEDSTRKTIAADGEHFHYNPKWILESTADDIKAALARLACACMLKHHTRRGERDYHKWQVASDLATLPILHDADLTDEQGGMDLPVEEIYAILPDPEEGDGVSPVGVPNPERDSNDSAPDPEQPGGATDNTERGKGTPDPSQSDADGSDGGGRPQASTDPSGRGEVMDAPKPDPSSGKSVEQHRQEQEAAWDKAAHQAMAFTKAIGTSPGRLQEIIDAAHQSSAPWQEVLRSWMTSVCDSDFSWRRPNRRFIADDIYLPSRHADSVGPIVVCIDTSASVASEELRVVWAEIRNCADETRPEKIVVLQIDTEICEIKEYEPENLPLTLKAKGRGGTEFTPAFKHIVEMNPQPAGVIFFTDLYVYRPAIEPECPVIWAVHGDNKDPVWFGERIDIPTPR